MVSKKSPQKRYYIHFKKKKRGDGYKKIQGSWKLKKNTVLSPFHKMFLKGLKK